MRITLLAAALTAALPVSFASAQGTESTARFRVTEFATGLERPWGGAFLPDGRLLVTERPGRMRLIAADGTVSPPLGGVPPVEAGGQGGLLDVAPAPDFAATRELFFCAAQTVSGGAVTRLWRARLTADGGALDAPTALLDATPAQSSGRNHFGCRITFDRDGALFLSTGDRYRDKGRAQKPDDLAGKILRLNRDGAPFADNPFAATAGARSEIWSLGHRNPQGLAFNPWTGSLWEAEFGPRGGDELNVIRRGGNYGWPVVTHGIDYDGSRISDVRSRPDMVDPIQVWTPVISPSGIAFYDGAAFPAWRRSLFLAALNPPGLVRLATDGDRVTGEERLLRDGPRLRHVIAGPDGRLYLLTDEARGRVLQRDPG